MTFFEYFLIGGVVVLAFMTIIWVFTLLLKNTSIVDIFWGFGFVVLNWVYFFLAPDGVLARKWLISVIVTIWGLRLSIYIFWRNWGKGEDFRYQKLRDAAGPAWWWQSYFKVFVFQGLVMWIVSAPLVFPHMSSTPDKLNILDYLGLALWAIGFYFESVGDFQLSRFKADPANKGKLLTSGVWRYTRHPNYFGDSAQWWGFYLIAAATGQGAYAFLSPIIMTFMLLRVTGVALLEKSLKDAKPGYEDYVRNTNAFIPWFPRKSSVGD
jgi:steroid 5-alpha reductase family enzyme